MQNLTNNHLVFTQETIFWLKYTIICLQVSLERTKSTRDVFLLVKIYFLKSFVIDISYISHAIACELTDFIFLRLSHAETRETLTTLRRIRSDPFSLGNKRERPDWTNQQQKKKIPPASQIVCVPEKLNTCAQKTNPRRCDIVYWGTSWTSSLLLSYEGVGWTLWQHQERLPRQAKAS